MNKTLGQVYAELINSYPKNSGAKYRLIIDCDLAPNGAFVILCDEVPTAIEISDMECHWTTQPIIDGFYTFDLRSSKTDKQAKEQVDS